MEVHWDPDRSALYAPPPREWARSRWLRQILDAARAQGCELSITDETAWVGIELEEGAFQQPESLAPLWNGSRSSRATRR